MARQAAGMPTKPLGQLPLADISIDQSLQQLLIRTWQGGQVIQQLLLRHPGVGPGSLIRQLQSRRFSIIANTSIQAAQIQSSTCLQRLLQTFWCASKLISQCFRRQPSKPRMQALLLHGIRLIRQLP